MSFLFQLFRISGHRGHGRWEVWVHSSTRAYGVCLMVDVPRALGPGVTRRDRLPDWVPVFPGEKGPPGGPTPFP